MFFALVWAIPGVASIIPFIALFGATYFFSQLGPNTTTSVCPSEIFPVDGRTTANGIALGVAKIGAFAGAAMLPALVGSMGISEMVLIPAALALGGALVTPMLPEPSGSIQEQITEQSSRAYASQQRKAAGRPRTVSVKRRRRAFVEPDQRRARRTAVVRSVSGVCRWVAINFLGQE